MKQTAIEKLVEEINKLTGLTIQMDEPCVQQAKAMEKEQIIRTHLMARCYDTENSVNEAEQYYKETYESNT